ncbi:MAG: TRAM domain-containing protein [Balneolaceae bacterium]|nr:TRAM domain-containing protein [Balneolaceae bacterium]
MSLKKGSDVELKIESTAFKGKGVARHNGMAVFVPNTVPGDRVEARIIKKKKNHAEGKLLEVLEGGSERIEPRCQHAKNCGGCSWQHVNYESQLKYKRNQVQDHMERIGGLTDLQVQPDHWMQRTVLLPE